MRQSETKHFGDMGRTYTAVFPHAVGAAHGHKHSIECRNLVRIALAASTISFFTHQPKSAKVWVYQLPSLPSLSHPCMGFAVITWSNLHAHKHSLALYTSGETFCWNSLSRLYVKRTLSYLSKLCVLLMHSIDGALPKALFLLLFLLLKVKVESCHRRKILLLKGLSLLVNHSPIPNQSSLCQWPLNNSPPGTPKTHLLHPFLPWLKQITTALWLPVHLWSDQSF